MWVCVCLFDCFDRFWWRRWNDVGGCGAEKVGGGASLQQRQAMQSHLQTSHPDRDSCDACERPRRFCRCLQPKASSEIPIWRPLKGPNNSTKWPTLEKVTSDSVQYQYRFSVLSVLFVGPSESGFRIISRFRTHRPSKDPNRNFSINATEKLQQNRPKHVASAAVQSLQV